MGAPLQWISASHRQRTLRAKPLATIEGNSALHCGPFARFYEPSLKSHLRNPGFCFLKENPKTVTPLCAFLRLRA
jgi:hypothetical protein